MAEERKKPKIDLKSRIPSKTVKGLTPAAGGAIPPPPGAVPAPPPDLLGRRPTQSPPKISADPNDPLGAATGGPVVQAQPQIVVVQAEDQGGVAAARKGGMFFAVLGAALVAGLGIGFLVGSASKGNEFTGKAKNDARDIADKIGKTNENLGKFLDTLKGAQSELQNSAELKPETITAIKDWSSGFGSGDLKGRSIHMFGEDTAGKLLNYAYKVHYIDELRAGMTKSNGLENANAQIKAFSIPGGHARWGVKINKPQAATDPQLTTADLIDFGEPVNLKNKDVFIGDKEKKLKAKAGEFDIDPGPKDFFSKGFVSAIEAKDWLKACPVYAQARGYTKQQIDELVVAIEGAGDDRGTLTPGKEIQDKLKTLVK